MNLDLLLHPTLPMASNGSIQLKDVILTRLATDLQRQHHHLQSKQLLKRIAEDSFPIPQPQLQLLRHGTSPVSSELRPESTSVLTGLQKDDRKLISKRIATGDKKLKTLLHLLREIEASCKQQSLTKSSSSQIFRSYSQGLLRHWLMNTK